ncbi:GntR family transcriptional regulator [Psychrobacillus psychrodurans]|uniref:GntR family transcriptional regulator n=1 Tax=Psychrobacillus psychrodurans TaxID=126157 RepID=A0A9X3LFS1_9BACI|nr:GntR family transcriptional regulator [Psychrobacillus psychrodurans]MCZ8535539.1 GntR family transcriptional regulator [Psychrobacillus psychrodurans]
METKYEMVKRAVQAKIKDGTYTPYQKISSESELMKEFSVSRHTVRQAIGDLVSSGWLYREQGSGTFCADRSKLSNLQNFSNQKKIAIVTTYLSDYIFPSIIRGAESILSAEGYQVSIFSTNNNHEMEREVLEKILSQQFDGVIVEPTKSAYSNPNITYYLNLEHLSIPYIMINAFYDELEPISIVMDDERGGFLQAEHLIKLGHKEIIGCFKTDDIQGVKRMKGFLKAHRINNIPLNPSHVITYNTDEKVIKPVEELEKLLSSNKHSITGIVCYNDELAMRYLELLRTKSINVPEDISIVGHDDSMLAQISEVKLTSIVHPKSELGESAAKVIMDLIKSNKNNTDAFQGNSIVYSPELVVRSSTKSLMEAEVTM